MTNQATDKIKRQLQTIGMSTFITYYYDFEKKTVQELVKTFEKNENWSESSMQTKASVGKAIFREGTQKKTLEIIKESKNIDDISDKAKYIYNNEYPDWQKIARDLQTLGMSTFVEYYYDFKNLTNQELFDKFEQDKNWSLTSKQTKVSVARNIFKKNHQRHTLELILSGRADENTIAKATEIYTKEYPDSEPYKVRFVRQEFQFGEDIINNLFSDYNIEAQKTVIVDGKTYKIDWYITEKNNDNGLKLAIEYDEKYHNQNKLEDDERQKLIETKLGCKFIRFRESDS